MELLARMKACPHRTGETACGCGGMARCALCEGRDGVVDHADCFACLQRSADDDGQPTGQSA